MNINGKHYRTIWLKEDDPSVVQIIDQRHLPHKFIIEDLKTVDEVAHAIKDMHIRGAGLVGATAGFGMYVSALNAPKDDTFLSQLATDGDQLKATRPTAVNLAWAVDRQLKAISDVDGGTQAKIKVALATAKAIADEDADFCRQIGQHGLSIIQKISEAKR